MFDFASKLLNRLFITKTGCWEFTGAITGSGYGAIYYEGKTKGAHVISYIYHKGPIPEGMFVCHSCDNPPCCNPEHLFLGTVQTNKKDEVHKGRNVYGEAVGNSKLKAEDVLNIRRMIDKGFSLASISRRYDVTIQNIHRIKSGHIWRWL